MRDSENLMMTMSTGKYQESPEIKNMKRTFAGTTQASQRISPMKECIGKSFSYVKDSIRSSTPLNLKP